MFEKAPSGALFVSTLEGGFHAWRIENIQFNDQDVDCRHTAVACRLLFEDPERKSFKTALNQRNSVQTIVTARSAAQAALYRV
jgi:hypothetical protein